MNDKPRMIEVTAEQRESLPPGLAAPHVVTSGGKYYVDADEWRVYQERATLGIEV